MNLLINFVSSTPASDLVPAASLEMFPPHSLPRALRFTASPSPKAPSAVTRHADWGHLTVQSPPPPCLFLVPMSALLPARRPPTTACPACPFPLPEFRKGVSADCWGERIPAGGSPRAQAPSWELVGWAEVDDIHLTRPFAEQPGLEKGDPSEGNFNHPGRDGPPDTRNITAAGDAIKF